MHTPSVIEWGVAGLVAGLFLTGGAQAQSGVPSDLSGATHLAFSRMTSGDAVGGAEILIEALRTCPADDAEAADLFVGSAQLLGFSIASLMDWPQRRSIQEELLRPDDHPTDRLLIAAMKAGSGVDGLALPAYGELIALSKLDHLPVRLTALYFIAQPYYYDRKFQQDAAIAEMMLSFPSLAMTRNIVEIPVWNTLKAARGGGLRGSVFQKVQATGGQPARTMQASPALQALFGADGPGQLEDIDDATVLRWAEALPQTADRDTRYGMLCALASVEWTPARRPALRAALAAIADAPQPGIDTIRAKILLMDLERAEHKPVALRALTGAILPNAPLPATPERSLYEATLHAMQHSARYFTRYGHIQDAIATHERVAARYPGTALAERETREAQALRDEGIGVSLRMLDRLARQARRDGGDAAAAWVYEDAAAHTTNPALAAEATRRISGE